MEIFKIRSGEKKIPKTPSKMTILTSTQQKFLELFKKEKTIANQFYLSGGTALAEFYLKHRLSEDLDFFTEKEVDFKKVFAFVTKAQKKLKATKKEYTRLYDRRIFHLKFPAEELKIEFTQYPFPQLQKPKKQNGLKVDSLIDISANKLFALLERFEPKDYIDLYFITKKYSIEKIHKATEKKFNLKIDLIHLGSTLLKGKKLPHLPKLLIKTKKEKIRDFFNETSKKFTSNIFT